MSWLGNFAGNVAGNFLGGLIGNANASSQMDKQAAINERMYRNRYQWSSEDLKAANLNPIIAAQGGYGASSASVGILGGSNTLAADVNSAGKLSLDKKLADSQVLNMIAQRDNINQDTNFKRSQTSLTNSQGQFYELNMPNLIELSKLTNINAAKQGALLDAQTLRQNAGIILDMASAEAANSAAARNNIETQLGQLDVDFFNSLGGGKGSADIVSKGAAALLRAFGK